GAGDACAAGGGPAIRPRSGSGSAGPAASRPRQDPLPVRVEPSEAENPEKDQHGPERRPAEGAEDQGPREQEHGQGIEDDEHQGDQVEADGKPDPGGAEGPGAAPEGG